jgi:hypothetical protein
MHLSLQFSFEILTAWWAVGSVIDPPRALQFSFEILIPYVGWLIGLGYIANLQFSFEILSLNMAR